MRVVAGPISESPPPITPPIADGARRVGDDQHLRIERALDAVERGQPLAGAGAADHQRPAVEPIEIERVHRLPELEHHVVGDVDDVVDRPDAGRFEAFGEPARARGRP